jgi:hypothetical protein
LLIRGKSTQNPALYLVSLHCSLIKRKCWIWRDGLEVSGQVKPSRRGKAECGILYNEANGHFYRTASLMVHTDLDGGTIRLQCTQNQPLKGIQESVRTVMSSLARVEIHIYELYRPEESPWRSALDCPSFPHWDPLGNCCDAF